jgi:hypothetical protein
MNCAHVALLAALALATTGCRSQHSVHEAYEAHEGTSKVYPLPAAEAYEVALDVLEDQGIDELDEFPKDQYAVGGFGMNFVSWGTWVGVWIDPIDANRSEVTVVTKRKAVMNVATVLTESTFHEEMRSRVGSRRHAARP